MAIARRTDGSDTHATSVTALSVTLGVTPVDDDQLIAILHHITRDDPTSIPAGWVEIARVDLGVGNGVRAFVYYKLAAGETGGAYAWTLPTNTKCSLWIGAYSGCDPGTAPQVTTSTPGAGTALDCPDVLVPDQGWLLSTACTRRAAGGSATTWTDSAGGDSERLDFSSNAGSGQDISHAVYDSAAAVAGPVNVHRTLTASQSQTNNGMMSIALTPAGGAVAAVAGKWGVHL